MKNSAVVVDSNLAVLAVVDSDLSPLASRICSWLIAVGANFFTPDLCT